MNKFVKTLLAYYSPYFLFLVYSLYASPAEANRLQAGPLGKIFSAYWIAGLLIVPLFAFGLPSAALIRDAVVSPRIREALRSKLLDIAFSLGLVLVIVLTVRLVPPQSLTSLIIDVVVFLATLCLLIWMRFGRRSG